MPSNPCVIFHSINTDNILIQVGTAIELPASN